MPDTIHRAARHALADDPWMTEKVAKATEVLDRIQEAGKVTARGLQATREAREAGLWKG